MPRRVYHVTPKGDDWHVRREAAERASSVHQKKSDAIARAKELAKRAALGQVKVHDHRGKIQIEYTYGKDPRKTPG